MNRQNVVTSPRLAGSVLRYHTWPTLNTQTIADHTFHVIRIYAALFGWPNSKVTEAIVKHDMPEIVTGDPPFPIKMQNPALKLIYNSLEDPALEAMCVGPSPLLSVPEAAQLKIADLLEMVEFGEVELMMGNRFAEPIINDTKKAALEKAESISAVSTVNAFLNRKTDTWRTSHG